MIMMMLVTATMVTMIGHRELVKVMKNNKTNSGDSK